MAGTESIILTVFILLFLLALGLIFGKGFTRSSTEEKEKDIEESEEPSQTPEETYRSEGSSDGDSIPQEVADYIEIYLAYIEGLRKLYRFAKSEIDSGDRRIVNIVNKFWNEVLAGNIVLDHKISDIFAKSRYLYSNFSLIQDNFQLIKNSQRFEIERSDLNELEMILTGINDLDRVVDSDKF